MFRRGLVPFVVLFFILLFPVERLHASPNRATIRVGIFQNRPIVYQDSQGVPQGLYVDLVGEIAKLEGWDIEFVPGTWANCLERVKAGEIDLLTSIAYTKERDRQMDYSRENVLTMWGQVYVRSNLEIETILDLNGRKIAILKDGINGINFMALCKKFNLDCKFVAVDSYTKVFELVASGTTDAGVSNNIHGYALEKDFKIQRSPILFNPFSLLFAVPEGMHHNLLSAIDKHLAEWKQNRTSFYYTTLDRWFGVRSRETILPQWVIILLGITGGITILAFGWMRVLKLQVKTRTRELQASNEQLQRETTERKQAQAQLIQLEKMKALDTLSAGIAHELNNPLMGMLNFVQYCIKNTSSDDRKYEVLKDTEDATQRCIDIVRNLLAFSRMGDKESYEKQSCGVLIDQALKLISYRTEGVLIEHCISEDTPEIPMKANGIRQVFLNLLTNALDAMENEEKKEIRITERREGEYVRITIADSGCGIPAEDTGKVLDPFFTTKGPTKGTGLGLSVSRTIVEEHGGMIRCESEPGEGSEFTILLPIESEARDE